MAHPVHRGALIGCGFIAHQKHLPALAKLQDRIQLVAFCDLIEARAQQAAAQYGAPDAAVYTDYRQLLRRGDIDVVYILTPNRSHCELAVAALEAGKDVLCEKPMALNGAEAKRMCEAAKASGRRLTIGYQNRSRLDSRYLKQVVQQGELGEIYLAKAHAVRRRGIPTWGVFLNEAEQGGGALIDIGTHALDLALWLMDNYEPERVSGSVYKKLGRGDTAGNAFGPWDNQKITVEDSAFGTIVMKNGATVLLEASWALNTLDTREQQVTLCGTAAGADMDDGVRINSVVAGALCETRPQLCQLGVPGEDLNKSEADFEAQQWLDALDAGTPPLVLPEQAMVVTQILEAIYTSARTGREVEF